MGYVLTDDHSATGNLTLNVSSLSSRCRRKQSSDGQQFPSATCVDGTTGTISRGHLVPRIFIASTLSPQAYQSIMDEFVIDSLCKHVNRPVSRPRYPGLRYLESPHQARLPLDQQLTDPLSSNLYQSPASHYDDDHFLWPCACPGWVLFHAARASTREAPPIQLTLGF